MRRSVTAVVLSIVACAAAAACDGPPRRDHPCYDVSIHHGLMAKVLDEQIDILTLEPAGSNDWGRRAERCLLEWMNAIPCLKTKPTIVLHAARMGSFQYDLEVTVNIDDTGPRGMGGFCWFGDSPVRITIWTRSVRPTRAKPGGRTGAQLFEAVMMHEMGHAMGLMDLYDVDLLPDFVPRDGFEHCTGQLMYNGLTDGSGLRDGDREGVWKSYCNTWGCAYRSTSAAVDADAEPVARTGGAPSGDSCHGWYNIENVESDWPTAVTVDFDGDDVADQGSYDPLDARWRVRLSRGGEMDRAFGWAGVDVPVPGDFDGDRLADVAVYRPTTGQWFISDARGGTRVVPFGIVGLDAPVAGDFDADGRRDLALYRAATGEWFVRLSRGGTIVQPFGAVGDVPVPADYDRDGADDLAVYRPSTGQWFLRRSSGGTLVRSWGWPRVDRPCPADYDGDRLADLAVYRPTTGEWFIWYTRGLGGFSGPFGLRGFDRPVPARYQAGMAANVAVFRPMVGEFQVLPTTWRLMPWAFNR